MPKGSTTGRDRKRRADAAGLRSMYGPGVTNEMIRRSKQGAMIPGSRDQERRSLAKLDSLIRQGKIEHPTSRARPRGR